MKSWAQKRLRFCSGPENIRQDLYGFLKKLPEWMSQEITSARWPSDSDFIQMETFLTLQEKGVPAAQAAALVFDDGEKIRLSLESGQSLAAVLSNRPGWKLLAVLCRLLDLRESVRLIHSLSSASRSAAVSAATGLLYPVCLLLGVFALVVFFEVSILPSVAEFLEGDLVQILFWLVRTVLLLVLVFSAGCFSLCFLGFEGILLPFSLLNRAVYSLNLVRQVVTIQLASLVQMLTRAGFSTEQVMDVLQDLDLSPCLADLADRLQSSFDSGTDLAAAFFSCAILDSRVHSFIQCGLQGAGLDNMLEVYCTSTKRKIADTIRKLKYRYTAGSYAAVGILAILVYQVLLAPMNMLSSM